MLSGIKKQLRSLTLLLLIFLIPVTVHAVDISGALWTANITFINVAIPLTEIQAPFEMSGSSLVDGSFMTSDALNSALQSGGLDFPSMPASDRIRVLGAVADDGGSFTDETTAANNSSFADVTLLPVAPAAGDAYYFIMDNPGRIITLNIGQAGIGTWDLAWEYWDGSTYSEITGSDIDDRTNNFTTFGVNTVSFAMPIDWEKRTVEGIDGYIIRARVATFTSLSTQPLATQLWYETGLWWTWIDSLDEDDQRNFVLYLGGPALQDHHQVFLSNEGITTVDHPSIEPGLTYAFQLVGRLNFDTIGACVICKGDDFQLTITDSDELTLSITGSGGLDLVIDGITLPETGGHIISIDSGVTEITFNVSPPGTTQSGIPQSIPDNGIGYTFMNSGAMVYLDTIALTTTGIFGELFAFNTEGEWDTGVVTIAHEGDEIDTIGGAFPLFTQYYYPEAETDDGYWTEGNTTFVNTSNFAIFGYSTGAGANEHNTFYRFDDVQVPQAATITGARMCIMPGAAHSTTTVNVRIVALDSDDADAPSSFSEAETPSSGRTTAFTDWDDLPSFTGARHPCDTNGTPHFTNVVQEIVDRPGWVSGNAMVFYIEDNGSTQGSTVYRIGSTAENGLPGPRFELTYTITPVLANDFLQLGQTGLTSTTDGPEMIDWVNDCGGTGCGGHINFDLDARFGSFNARLDAGTGPGGFGQIYQDLTASSGEVWSFRWGHAYRFTKDDSAFFRYSWLDSDKVIIGSVNDSADFTTSANYIFTNIDGVTAPSGTAFVRIEFRDECIVPSCTSQGAKVDGVVACVCNPAPDFPDAANRVLNPSFENVTHVSGSWTSPTLKPTSTNILTSAIFWTARVNDGLTASSEDLIVSVSTTAGAPFEVITDNGGPIPSLSPGDDASQLGLRLRFTLYSTGSAETLADEVFFPAQGIVSANTPIVSEALVFLVTEAGPTNADLFYQLDDTPSFFIDDRSINSNIGDLNLPLLPLLPLSFVSALQSTTPIVSQTQGGVGAPSFADQITPPVNTFPTGGTGSNLPLFAFFDLMSNLSGLPTTIFMLMVAMIVIIFAGVITFQAFNSTTVAYLTMMIAMIAFTFIDNGVIPWWIILVFGLVGGFWVLKPRTSV